ncbi:autotransporter assembly complex family protein [Pyruvatibacter sp.]|uniref:autotransporter assembly complex protein TamA n=1 Tax=Pyruvatibacter sp. TaxID=1981328 RepID=UPI0032EBE7A5
MVLFLGFLTGLRRAGLSAGACFFAGCLLAGAAHAANHVPVGERGYTVRVVDGAGVLLPAPLAGQLEEMSQLVARRSEPPPGIGGVRRRAQGDVQRLGRVLQAHGYFEGTVAYELDLKPSAPDQPVNVTLVVEPGPQYLLGTSTVSYMDTQADTASLPQGLGDAGVEPGRPAIAADILAAETKLAADLRARGFAFARVADRRALANVETDVLDVTTFISLGDRAQFGALTVEGLERVEPHYIERRRTFKQGEEFDPQKLADMRAGLARSGLFNAVRFETAETLSPDGTLPVTLMVSERAPRTVGAGASFSSTEGFGVNAHWEHRNLLGGGQHLRLEATLAQIEQELAVLYRVAGFRRADQTLELGLAAGREETDVYTRTGAVITTTIERPLADRWTGRAGLSLDVAQVDEEGESSTRSTLVGLPLQALYDGADSALDPTRGVRLRVKSTPYAGHFDKALAFHVADVELRSYVPLDDDGRLVFATRGRLGSILGARTGELPADKRFYAGGAGSIRGFEFQEVAPLGADGTAEGGRGLAELSAELRWRFADDFGIVPFVDAGHVSDAPIPDFSDEIAWAGGLGFRYYTSFGPIGIDFAYPIATPSDEDPSLKFYVKLGQAF